MAEVPARLDHLQLLTDAPERLVAFYGEALGMTPERLDANLWLCRAPERRVLIGRGPSRTLGYAAYRCDSEAALAALRTRLEANGVTPAASPSPLLGPHALSVVDPDGNTMVFGFEPSPPSPPQGSYARRARLQHVALASDHPEQLLRFYTEGLGFVLSDTVVDHGALSACWLRSDREHHTMAVFRTRQSGRRLDHYSFEVAEWTLIRDWADGLAARGIGLVWGPGRHGPGNNLFIMIRDPDDTLIEFSAELEVITNDRPARVWPQTERTFNQWGSAALRT